MRSRPPGRLPPFVPGARRYPRPAASSSSSRAHAGIRGAQPSAPPAAARQSPAPRVLGRRLARCRGSGRTSGWPPGSPRWRWTSRWPRRRPASACALGSRRDAASISAGAPQLAASRALGRRFVRHCGSRRTSACPGVPPRTPSGSSNGRGARPRPSARLGGGARLGRCSPAPASHALGRRFVRRRSFRRASACTDGYPRTPRGFFSGRGARPRPSARSGGGVRLGLCSLARGVARSRPAIRAPPRPSVPVRVPGRISPDPERVLHRSGVPPASVRAQEEWPEMRSASGLMVVVAAWLIFRELRGSSTS